MSTFIGPDIFLSDLTEGPTLFAQSGCPLWSSVYKCQRVEYAFTSPVRTECSMFVMYCMQCCMSVSAVL